MSTFKYKMFLNWSSVTGAPCEPINWVRGENGLLPAVHQHVGGLWYWYDETQADEFGGFCTREEAENSLARYCAEVLGVTRK